MLLYQSKLYYSPKFSSIMPMQYENSTMQLDYIEYAIGIRTIRSLKKMYCIKSKGYE
jgi:hypothetical protein